MPESRPASLRSSALAALLLLFAPALGASTTKYSAHVGSPVDQAGIEGFYMLLQVNPAQLSDGLQALNFPQAPSTPWAFYGGGLVARGPMLHVSSFAATGALNAELNGSFASWNLDLVGLVAEQRYSMGGWEYFAGFAGLFAQYTLDLRDAGGSTQFMSRFPGAGVTLGARWPAETKMGFYTRGGYLWLPAAGAWHGPLAGQIGKSYFELSAPFAQAGVDWMF